MVEDEAGAVLALVEDHDAGVGEVRGRRLGDVFVAVVGQVAEERDEDGVGAVGAGLGEGT